MSALAIDDFDLRCAGCDEVIIGEDECYACEVCGAACLCEECCGDWQCSADGCETVMCPLCAEENSCQECPEGGDRTRCPEHMCTRTFECEMISPPHCPRHHHAVK